MENGTMFAVKQVGKREGREGEGRGGWAGW